MRVAALCDIHANLPALEAVLAEVREARVDRIVFGGDIVPGPMMRETLERILTLDIPAHFVHGNGELGMLAQIDAPDPSAVTYWGTTSGSPLPEPLKEVVRWSAGQMLPDHARVMAIWPRTMRLEIPGVGKVLFCHATPHSETDAFTRLTPEEVLLPVFQGLDADVVVCGHTHMQFDRMIGGTRVVNAGSVGMPFGAPGAYWLLLGPGVELRRTAYDLQAAAARIRASHDPSAEDFIANRMIDPPSEAVMLDAFASREVS